MKTTLFLVACSVFLFTTNVWSETYRDINEKRIAGVADNVSKAPVNSLKQKSSEPRSNIIDSEIVKYLGDLKSNDTGVRVNAAKNLAKRHYLAGVRLALKDVDKKVRHAAVLNTSINLDNSNERRDPEAEAIFVECLKDIDKDVKTTALDKLHMDTDTCRHVAKLLDDPSEYIRAMATSKLGACQDIITENKLLRIANDKKEVQNIRTIALRNLAKSKTTGLDEKLIRFLLDKTENKEIKRAAIYSLGKLKSQKAVDTIIPFVYDSDQQVHYSAVDALGEIGDPRAAQALADVLTYKNGKINTFALKSLRKACSPNVLPKLLKIKPLLSDSDEKIKFVEALGAMGSDAAAAALLEIIVTEPDSGAKSSASRVLDRFDSPAVLNNIISSAKNAPGNQQLSYLAKKAQHKLDFPEEALKEKEKQKEVIYVQEQEQEINKIYNAGFRLFREGKYEKALPYYYEAADRFEKLYASHPSHFRSSNNKIAQIRCFLAAHYRFNVNNPEKAIGEYTSLIYTLKKYVADDIISIPYWLILGDIYEKDINNYQRALDCYKKASTLAAMSIEEQYKDKEIFVKWYFDWINFLHEKVNVLYLKNRQPFSYRTLKYPNVEYNYFFASEGQLLAFSAGSLFADDLFNDYRETFNLDLLDKLNAKYHNSYEVMFYGIVLFHNSLKDNMMDNAVMVSEKLINYYPDDINMLMLQLEVADIYKKQNRNQKYKEAIGRSLELAKKLNIYIVFGPDQRFSSPEKTWQLMLESLRKGEINIAIECFTPTSQHKYKEIFTILKDKLNVISSDLGKTRKVKTDNGRAEYMITITENGKQISYELDFVDVFGEWKIDQF